MTAHDLAAHTLHAFDFLIQDFARLNQAVLNGFLSHDRRNRPLWQLENMERRDLATLRQQRLRNAQRLLRNPMVQGKGHKDFSIHGRLLFFEAPLPLLHFQWPTLSGQASRLF